MTSIVTDLATDICWETLWDTARKLKLKEVEQLELVYDDIDPDPFIAKVIGPNYNRPLNKEQVD